MAARHVGIALARGGCVAEIAPPVDHLLRRAPADPELQPAARNEVGRACVLSHVQRILVTHVDHGRPDLDCARPRADGGKHWKGRAELPPDMLYAELRPCPPQLPRGPVPL